MDDILEFIFELVMEILGSVIESDRVPKPVRYILIAVIAIPLLTLLGFTLFKATDTAILVILTIIAVGLAALFIYLVIRINKSCVLTPAQKEALPQILKMYRSYIGTPGCTWNILYPNEAILYNDFLSGNLYVLRRGKHLIGAGAVADANQLDALDCWAQKENAGEIARIVIAKAYQGKGYGRQLIRKLCSRLEHNGCKAVRLLVSPENHRALSLYQKAGFQNKGKYFLYEHDYFAYEKKL